MIAGLFFAFIAGSLVGLQNIFNSKVNEHAGSWVTTTLVLGLGFLASLTLGLINDGRNLFIIHNMQIWCWFSGLIGVGVVVCLMNGIKLLGPTFAILLVMTSQLGFALLWDSLGWFGLVEVPFTLKQFIGVLVIMSGVLVFKLSERQKITRSKNRLIVKRSKKIIS
ncbi:DMT family transporter [Sporolactobacillus laevolacticus]|uniref:Membrane protein n=1 Tax=Sporolactobacillus laevolacticus DSM 442 TaxID=1395513 RepID=V6IWY8_9BACL|nr:DMT family transporter [Sporolactobacillus laevolacticus]EST11770.1 membrane protein [Sporolactobacillus laevolacticus DSM 442]